MKQRRAWVNFSQEEAAMLLQVLGLAREVAVNGVRKVALSTLEGRIKDAFAAQTDSLEQDDDFRQRAREIHGEDDIQIDGDAALSVCDEGGGAWVQGWLHVPDETTGVEMASTGEIPEWTE